MIVLHRHLQLSNRMQVEVRDKSWDKLQGNAGEIWQEFGDKKADLLVQFWKPFSN